ncbi:MAG: hypothetical protein J6P50_07600 [Bacteroidales bacterium]|nr:hypothetical protein [Bacteroidales bacterium]
MILTPDEVFGPTMDKVAAIAPSCAIWNGDATNCEETIGKIVITVHSMEDGSIQETHSFPPRKTK